MLILIFYNQSKYWNDLLYFVFQVMANIGACMIFYLNI